MKARLNITIEDTLLSEIKRLAANKHTSVSELVEEYFKSLTKPARQKTIIHLVEQLEKPAFDTTGNLKESYHQDQKEKYGF